jgi:hypothetical protein
MLGDRCVCMLNVLHVLHVPRHVHLGCDLG